MVLLESLNNHTTDVISGKIIVVVTLIRNDNEAIDRDGDKPAIYFI